jgi:hypothetical protein
MSTPALWVVVIESAPFVVGREPLNPHEPCNVLSWHPPGIAYAVCMLSTARGNEGVVASLIRTLLRGRSWLDCNLRYPPKGGRFADAPQEDVIQRPFHIGRRPSANARGPSRKSSDCSIRS